MKDIFGFDEFRDGQEEIINSLVDGKDTLAVMPTGSGKSLCYQLPSAMGNGLAIVVSPLISLMKDQVDFLNSRGLKSCFVNSSLSWKESGRIMGELLKNRYKFLYVAPERLMMNSFDVILRKADINTVVIDEAHCVSQWGNDFRPSYGRIGGVISKTAKKPVIAAFTATATARIKNDIVRSLGMKDAEVIVRGFDRPNLFFEVLRTPAKDEALKFKLRELKLQYGDCSGIIYTATRNEADRLRDLLDTGETKVIKYHAGMSGRERETSQNMFFSGENCLMVATNAFGMGIDKKNIRFTIHYNMPKDIESYYQEAGRAGRDGKIASCSLIFSRKDIVIQRLLMERENPGEISRAVKTDSLHSMINYCYTSECLRNHILNHFQETLSGNSCGGCSNCAEDHEIMDITLESRKIISCVYRLREFFGPKIVAGVLKGNADERFKDWKIYQMSTFGIMNGYEEKLILHFIYSLCGDGILEYGGKFGDKLHLNQKSWEVLRGERNVVIRKNSQIRGMYSTGSVL